MISTGISKVTKKPEHGSGLDFESKILLSVDLV